MTRRPVFCTDWRIVSLSNGASVRGSTTHGDPSPASSSAASAS
jgi:hypothetical protein